MITERAMQITPFIVMDVLEQAAKLEQKGVDVVHLEMGEPDFNTPPAVIEAANKAMRDGKTHYTHSLGRLELREAVCEYYLNRYGVDISPERVVVTAGTSPALLLAFSTLIDKGDRAILPNPHYACYPSNVRFFGGECVFVDVEESDGFQYRPERIREVLNPKVKAIMINSPSNPAGTIMDAESMAAVAEMGPMIVSDEIYHGLVYEGKERSILEFTDRAIVLNGFSKIYAMTGWRLGYLILPPDYVRPIQKMHQNFFISAADFVQVAGIAALRETKDDVERMVRTYNERRKVIVPRLREIGFGIEVEPTGAFYVFANAKQFSEDSYALAFDILENAHVGVAPGIDFGSHAEGYLRFSYAASLERIEEGLNRIESYLNKRA